LAASFTHEKANNVGGDMGGMLKEYADLLHELRAMGQIGAIVLIILLSLVVIACLWMLFLQKRFINLTSEAQKFIDGKMRAADMLREEDRRNQEVSINDVRSRIDSLAKINDELRKEIDRLAKQQKGLADSQAAFRQSVKDSITLGLDDINERLTSVTLTEIADQIPPNFKAELQRNLIDVSKQVAADTIARLKNSPEIFDQYFSIEIRGAVSRAIERLPLLPFDPSPDEFRFRQNLEYFVNHVAYLIAEQLTKRAIGKF
jgi:low affinity Fe/Cu permease